ncbi:MAG: SGNH/GDSL hydrolase family protein [Clostridia bacterium]|nr:SGNH/GDSL hydrolase family protein [Clostridia bacterium]
MKLSDTTVKKFYKGAVHFEKDRGYLIAYKYSKAQLDYMANPSYDHGWRWRAKISGGIRLELITDATELSFDYTASHTHETANTVDLYIDNILYSVYEIGEKLKGKITFTMPKGEKRATVYLPCESIFGIKNFEINGGYKSVKSKGPKILVLGDSITQGAGPQIASASYLNTLSRELNATFLGQGVGGYRYEPCDLMRVDGFEPDKIIVFLGTNYYDTPLEQYDYKGAVNEYYRVITEMYPDIPILSITPLWRNNDVDFDRLHWCIDTIKDACSHYEQVIVADGFSLVPNVDQCFSDGVHPNAYGSRLLATNLISFMKKSNFIK